MRYSFSELFPSTAVSDAVLLPSFIGGSDALCFAEGTRLVLHAVTDGFLEDPTFHELYGTIARLAPIQPSHSSETRLLVILGDLRAALIGYDDTIGNLVTISSGNLMPAHDCQITSPRFALHPTALVLQIGLHQLQVFPFTSNSSLGTPFPVLISCREIIDFVFTGPTSKVTRLGVLTKEFDQTTLLRIIEIDTSCSTFSEDSAQSVALPNDTYLLLAYDPEHESIIVAFSAQQATRVLYAGLTPRRTTATISTPFPILRIARMEADFYLAIDEGLNLRAVTLATEGTVHFIDVDTAPRPTALVPITPTVAFVGSAEDDSVLFLIDQKSQHQISSVFATMKGTGKVRSFVPEGDDVITLFEHAVVHTEKRIPFNVSMAVEVGDCVKFWTVPVSGLVGFVLTTAEATFGVLWEESGKFSELLNLPFVRERSTRLFVCQGDRYVQISSAGILLLREFAIIEKMAIPDIEFAAWNGETVAIVSSSCGIRIFELGDRIRPMASRDLDSSVSAIAFSGNVLAIATTSPPTVQTLNPTTLATLKTIPLASGPVFGLCIGEDSSVVAVHSSGVSRISGVESIEYPFEGIHTGIEPFDDGFFIAGEHPAILTRDSVRPIESCPLLSLARVNEQVCGLSPSGLLVGQFGPPEYVSRCFRSDSSVVGHHKHDQFYVIARMSQQTKQVQLHLSLDRFATRESDCFYSYPEGDLLNGFVSIGDSLFVSTTSRLTRFVTDRAGLTTVGEATFPDKILSFGQFDSGFLYIQFQDRIDFITVDSVTPREVEMNRVFRRQFVTPIVAAAFKHGMAVIVAPRRTVGFYLLDDARERLVALPVYTALEDISTAAIVESGVVLGSTNGNVVILALGSHLGNGETGFEVAESFSVGEQIVALATDRIGRIFIGTKTGMVAKVETMPVRHQFAELYRVLQGRVTSLGKFNKALQRYARCGKYIMGKSEICEMALVRAFMAMPEEEQTTVLEGSDFGVAQALEVIRGVTD
jgi:hypothetical protein